MEPYKIQNPYGLPIYIWVAHSDAHGKVLRIEIKPDEHSADFVAIEFYKDGTWCVTQNDEGGDWFKILAPCNVRDLLASIFLKDYYAIQKVIERIRPE